MTPASPEGSQMASLAGTVRLADGRPVTGAAVTVAEPGTGNQVSTARTASSGTFRVGLPSGGTYLLIVSAAGRRPSASLIAVTDGPARHDVVLGGSCALAGIARVAGSSAPAPGAVVTLTDARGQVIATATAAADGAYRLDDLEPGDYTLVGTAPAMEPVARTVSVPGSEDLVFTEPRYRVTALVTGPDGAPFAGAVVTLTADGPDAGPLARNVSDAQGRAAFDDVPDGRYTLGAEGAGPGVAIARAEPGQVTRADIRLGALGDGPGQFTLPEPRFSPESEPGQP